MSHARPRRSRLAGIRARASSTRGAVTYRRDRASNPRIGRFRCTMAQKPLHNADSGHTPGDRRSASPSENTDVPVQDATRDDNDAMTGWQGKAYAFFCNRACEFFPCHETDDEENLNCLFCFCPLYPFGSACGGTFSYTKDGVKDCGACLLPHLRENFGIVAERSARLSRRWGLEHDVLSDAIRTDL